MNSKTKNYFQVGILFAIYLIESIGFSDKLKYNIINYFSLNLTDFLLYNLIWIKIGVIVLLLVPILFLRKKLKKKEVELYFIVFLIKGFQKKSSSFIGLANTFFVGYSMAVIFNEFGLRNFNGILNGLIYFGFLILYSIIIANYFVNSTKKTNKQAPKVLISALSIIKEDTIIKCLTEMKNEFTKEHWLEQVFYKPDGSKKMLGGTTWGPWANLDPVRKSIIVHESSLEKIILLSSTEAFEACQKLPENVQPVKLITDFVHIFYPNRNISISIIADGKSGNNMKENGFSLENILKTLNNKGYNDENIVFNITSGTVAISGAMILKAIAEGRLAEYTNQDTGLIEDVPLTILDVKDLWEELLEKVG